MLATNLIYTKVNCRAVFVVGCRPAQACGVWRECHRGKANVYSIVACSATAVAVVASVIWSPDLGPFLPIAAVKPLGVPHGCKATVFNATKQLGCSNF